MCPGAQAKSAVGLTSVCCAASATQIAIEKLEQKLRTLHTNIYTMQDFVRTKESETNYKTLAHSITLLADEVNGTVKRQLA
jgi:intraflagellar transport protein 74